MKKITALLITALTAFGIFTACASANAENIKTQPSQEAHEEARDSLTIVMESEPTTLNPFDHAAVTSGYMNEMTFNRLFKFDVETLEPVPDLCESFESLDDETWLFTIKKGVMFHDGTEMRAEDVKASMEFARNFTSSNKYTSFWTSVETVDDFTVKITTKGPYALILSDLAANGNTIVPKHLIDAGNDFSENPVGSGPYKFVNWTLGDSLTFVRNENYFDKDNMPSIENVTWKIIPEGSSRTIALETGEADLVIDVESTDADRLAQTEGITLMEKDGTRMNFLALNNEKAPFDNILVRKAVNALINKEAVIEVAANGQGKVSQGMNPAAYAGTTAQGADEFSPEKAAEYLAQAGVDPSEIRFTCMVYTDATRRAAEVIQGCLLEAGIEMEIESLDFAAFLSRLLEGEYEAGIAGFSSTDIITYMKGLWHSSSIDATNSTRMINSEIDALIDEASAQLDEEARTALVTEICRLTNEECPFAPLYTSSVSRAFSSDLQGMSLSASGLTHFGELSW